MKKTSFSPVFLLICFSALLMPYVYGTQPSMKLRYNRPADHWMTTALPIGNGEIGALFFGTVPEEHIQFNDKTLWTGSDSIRGAYQNFGDIYISFPGHNVVTGYSRELDLEDGVGRVAYECGGQRFLREYFVSRPDEVAVFRFTSDGNLNMDIRLEGAHGEDTELADSTLTIRGSFELLSYEATLTVLPEGGRMKYDGRSIRIVDAESVTMLLAAATNFDIHSPSYTGISAHELSDLVASRSKEATKSYATLLARHQHDYQPLFESVKIDLNEEIPVWTTDNMILNHRDSRYLDMLYFQYGRYLMIASSRGMDLPNNLQGIWNASNTPPWECDIHSNINIQMNYWPAEVANLSECHMPFINYIVAEATERDGGGWHATAEAEGLRGWAMRTQSNIFGYTDWNINRPANAWYCMHLWNHYAYNHDIEYLVERAFPAMKSACEYWFDRLADDGTGLLVAPAEWSPEQGPWEDGVAYAQQLIAELFDSTIKALEAMRTQGYDVDERFEVELLDKNERLDRGLAVGDWGQIKEWRDGGGLDSQGNTHRHISQLIALYPGNAISYHADSAYAAAARRTLESRGDGGTGWSRAWKIACYARLFDGDHAYRLLKSALNPSGLTRVSMKNEDGGVYPNLFDSHPPFQIDGNFGATAGVAEMLLQSNRGYIHPIPALPSAWPSGTVEGLRAEGDFSVDMSWNDMKLTDCTVVSGSGLTCRLWLPSNVGWTLTNREGAPIPYSMIGENMIEFPTEKEGIYRLKAQKH